MGMARFVNAGRFGWGLLLAWLFCTYYTGIATPSVDWVARMSLLPAGLTPLFEIVPLLSAMLTIVVLIALERRGVDIARSRVFLWVGAALCSAGTPLAFSMEVSAAVSLAGIVFTGIGSSVLWMLWGSYYTRIASEDTEAYACVSAVTAAVLMLGISLLPGWMSLAAVTLLPIGSGLLLVLAQRDLERADGAAAEERIGGDSATDSKRSFGIPPSIWKSAAVLCVMYAFISLLGQMGVLPNVTSAGFRIAVIISGVFIAIIGAVSVRGPRRFSVPFLLRWMVPLLVVGFAAIVIFGDEQGARIASNVSGAGRLGFCLVAQIYFSRFADEGFATAIQAYGIGWLSVHVGDFIGLTCGFASSFLVSYGAGLAQLAGVAIVLASFMVLIPFGADGVFQVDRPAGADVASEELGDATKVESYEDRVAAFAAESGLTKRETEVFSLLMQGRSVPYIRDKLVVSRDTVATHVKHIYTKTGVHSRQELLDLVE